MICKYCNLKNYTQDEFTEYQEYYQSDAYYELAEAPYTSLVITHNSKTGKYGLKANGDYEPGIDIEFCPFCGRKLTED